MCTLAMLVALAGIPKGSTVIIPAPALQDYTPAEIEQGKRCCRSRGIVCLVGK